MTTEELLNEIVFELWDLNQEKQVIDYDNHKIIIDEINEEENLMYDIPICETLLKIIIDDTVYLATVATRMYCQYQVLGPLNWRCY